MAKAFALRMVTLLFAFAILILSVFDASTVEYAFGALEPRFSPPPKKVDIPYNLPSPGDVQPGSVFWPMKALKEKAGFQITNDPAQRAEYSLFLGDKRLAIAWELWMREEVNQSLATFEKAEKYLLNSFDYYKNISDASDKVNVSREIVYSSLKHREMLEHVLANCGDEARAMVTKLLDTPKMLYEVMSNEMLSLGQPPPTNPF